MKITYRAMWYIGAALGIISGAFAISDNIPATQLVIIIAFVYYIAALAFILAKELRGLLSNKVIPDSHEQFLKKYKLSDEDFHALKHSAYDTLIRDGGIRTSELIRRAELKLYDFEEQEQLFILTYVGFSGIFRFGQDSNGLWWRVQDSKEVSDSWVDKQPKPVVEAH